MATRGPGRRARLGSGGLGDAEWVQVGALLRGDFPAETLAALARGGRRLLLDGHGLARLAQTGPLRRDGEFDRATLEEVAALKLSSGEAEAIGLDLGALSTLGSRSSSRSARAARSCSRTTR